MRFPDFDRMVQRMTADVPAEYLDGVADIHVARAAVPDPVRGEIWTMGECVPLPGTDDGLESVQSRVILYHGSFAELARRDRDFDWREEAWETLTHELRHHLEWRARTTALEAFDRAAEANYARHDGEPFDPLFYHDGELAAPGVWRVEYDYFLEQVVSAMTSPVHLDWHGKAYQFDPPAGAGLPTYFLVDGVDDPPPGDLVVVVRRRPGLRDILRRSPLQELKVSARPAGAPPA